MREREQFETTLRAGMLSWDFTLDRDDNDLYDDVQTQAAWHGWQARAALSQPAASACPTCKGDGRVLHIYERPGGPAGNAWIKCHDPFHLEPPVPTRGGAAADESLTVAAGLDTPTPGKPGEAPSTGGISMCPKCGLDHACDDPYHAPTPAPEQAWTRNELAHAFRDAQLEGGHWIRWHVWIALADIALQRPLGGEAWTVGEIAALKAVVEELGNTVKDDGGCDHSVGICACATIRNLEIVNAALRRG